MFFMGKVKLNSEEKGILKYLSPNSKEAISLDKIKDYLISQEYGEHSLKDVREDMDYLIDKGYACSKTIGTGEDRKELFYLTKTPLGGQFKRRQTQGRDLVSETVKAWNKIFNPKVFGSIFLLFGLGAIVYEGMDVTGAVISNGVGVGLTFIFAFALMIIGGILVKKKKN